MVSLRSRQIIAEISFASLLFYGLVAVQGTLIGILVDIISCRE